MAPRADFGPDVRTGWINKCSVCGTPFKRSRDRKSAFYPPKTICEKKRCKLLRSLSDICYMEERNSL